MSVRPLGYQQQMPNFLRWVLFTYNVNLVNFLSNYQEAMDETFILSNIAPQVGDGFNRHCESFVPYRFFSTLLFIIPLDWAYVEDWCRRLTGSFKDVYVFTIPLYLPRQEADGKWRVVSRYSNNLK
jgi:hypothetical protein